MNAVHIKDLTDGDPHMHAAPYCNTGLVTKLSVCSSLSTALRSSQPFHTDAGDVVAMFVFGTAAQGGHGTFAPVSTIYNELASSSPDLLTVLNQPDWPFDR